MKYVKLLILLAVAVTAIGYWRGWFTVEKTGDQSVTVSVNKDRLKEDTTKAGETVKDVAGDLKEKLAGAQKVSGRVVGVDVIAGSLRLKPDAGAEMAFKIDKAMLDAATLAVVAAVASGDAVTVEYETKDGAHLVKKLQRN